MALPRAAPSVAVVTNPLLSATPDLLISKELVQQEGDMGLQQKCSGFNFSFWLAKNFQYSRVLAAFQ